MIWTISKGVYRYLRQNRILPLPSERLLEQKINHIKLPPGFLDNIADILRTKAAILSERNRAVHLSFDEVKQIFKAISDLIVKKYMILSQRRKTETKPDIYSKDRIFVTSFAFCVITFQPIEVQTCSAPQNDRQNLVFVKDI